MDKVSRAIAFYQGENAPGAFAPSGWHCQVSYGSAGGKLLVTPVPLNSTSSQGKARGQMVEISALDGGTSGRFGVADYAARLFPRIAAKFIDKVKAEDTFLVSPSDSTNAEDSIFYWDSSTVEFTTPPGKAGLGTNGQSIPHDAIRGIVIIYCPQSLEPGLSILRVSLGSQMRELESAILRLNKQQMERIGPC